jgi:hypothetical protein
MHSKYTRAVLARNVIASDCAPLGEFVLGVALAGMRDVATGTKPITVGEVRRSDRRALQELLWCSGYGGTVRLAFRQADGEGNVGYCLWHFAWAKKALDWLDRCGRDKLGDYHRHWVQGLLFGYGGEAIASFLARPSGRGSRSLPSCSSRKAGSARPSRAVSRSRSSSIDKLLIPDKFLQFSSLFSFRGLRVGAYDRRTRATGLSHVTSDPCGCSASSVFVHRLGAARARLSLARNPSVPPAPDRRTA